MIKRLPSFVALEDHANFADQLNVIARNKCYMFKLFGFVSKLSLLDKYSVIYGDRTNLLPDESAELKAVAHSILKRLRGKDFSSLARALEKQGGCETPCIFFQTHERLGKRVVVEPQVVLFRIFRLPQIQNLSELKHIAACSPCHDIDGKVCINPFHYSATISSGLFIVVKSEIFAISDSCQCIGIEYLRVSFAYETFSSRFVVLFKVVIYFISFLTEAVDAIITSFPSVMELESGESSGMYSKVKLRCQSEVSCSHTLSRHSRLLQSKIFRFSSQGL